MSDAEVDFLLSLQAVRERAQKVLGAARQGSLNSFDYDEGRMAHVADFVSDIISVGSSYFHAFENDILSCYGT